MICDLEQQTWAACSEAVQSGRHKKPSLFWTVLQHELFLQGAAVGERNVLFVSWQTMREAFWLFCDFSKTAAWG